MAIEQVEVFTVHFDVEPLRSVSIAPIPIHDFVLLQADRQRRHSRLGRDVPHPGHRGRDRGPRARCVLGQDAPSTPGGCSGRLAGLGAHLGGVRPVHRHR